MSHEAYVAGLAASGLLLPKLFLITALRLEGVMLDVLHVLDQGLTTHLIGNVWWEIMSVMEGPNEAERLKKLVADIKGWHARNNKQLNLQGKLTVARIRAQGDWPKLKAKATPLTYE